MRRKVVVRFGLLSLCLALAGCGGDGLDFAACRAAMTALCDKACECTPGDGCDVGNDIGGLFPFADRQECLDWYVGMGCRDTDGDFPPDSFFEGCQAALPTATCRTDPTPALIMPGACIYQTP